MTKDEEEEFLGRKEEEKMMIIMRLTPANTPEMRYLELLKWDLSMRKKDQKN